MKNNDRQHSSSSSSSASQAGGTAAFAAAFVAGLLVIGWVAWGYGAAHPLALGITLLISGFYLLGARELHRYRQGTGALAAALQAPPADAAALDGWLGPLPAALRSAVRQRIDGLRAGLPAPVMAPYLTGLLVLLGMVGTFLGMVVTLQGTGAALAGADGLAAIRDALSAPVRGLGLAFGTSVAGVAASAMLGLMGALARRERLLAAQQLDALLPTALRPFTPQHQREAAWRLQEQQAGLLPTLVDRIGDAMAAMERSQAALAERLQAEQARFYRETESAYTGLAAAVERTLSASTAESARLAGAALQPAIEAALAGLARESAALQTALADQVRRQLDGMAGQFGTATAAITTHWTGALAEQQRTSDASAQALRGTLEEFTQRFEQRSAALADSLGERLARQSDALSARWGEALAQQAGHSTQLAERHEAALSTAAEQWARHAEALHAAVEGSHTRLQADAAAQDAARQAAWNASLQTLAASLQHEWQTAQAGATAQWKALGETLATTADGIAQRSAEQATQLLSQIDQRAAQDEARQTAWTQSLQAVAETLRAEWQAAQAQSTGQWRQLGEVLATTADGIAQRSAEQATQLLSQIDQRAVQDEARQTAWTQSLQAVAETLRTEWQAAQAQSTGQWHQLGEVLAATSDGIAQRSAEQAAQLLLHIDQRAAQDESRQAAWTQSLEALSATLRSGWEQAGARTAERWDEASQALARSTGQITEALDAHAQRTLGEIGTLVQAASEAPRAAAEVIGELRQKLSDSMARDNAMLEERSRILETLSTLLEAVNHASAQQRSAIDTLVAGTAELMERSGTRFADTVQAQAERMDAVAAQLTGSAVEVASLGEAFGAAVQHFGHANEQMVAQLQRVEAALAKSLARSDEQLDYYVAQAREVIELSVGAQKQVVDGLQQVAAAQAGKPAPAAAEAAGA
jgi:F0F1-type ATP synthase assembly protein I